jgi:glycosyltransferase involved in cell wall biosynthesis/SAM-dependent methyltransferase
VATKIAFFSPLPPARSGIADYSAALLHELRKLAEVEVFASKPAKFDPAAFDVILYQIGNNAYHDFCYELALEHPGVVVVHEANLHHLIADITIKRGDWDAYMRVLGEEGGPQALEYGKRVRALEIAPDYEGVPMLRSLLGRSKGAIVHSGCVEAELRSAGFDGPVARIPHGAWIPETNRLNYRSLLGVDEATPLIGIFGFLKPYKRIAESLRAFRRLLRVTPDAKMILVGEPHPDFPLHSLIQSLGLTANVRVLGFQPIPEFVGYLAACDIVLNLRYPTVGENSGTLMRALGLGKAVIVSEVGSFLEFPDAICLKTPVDADEEAFLFEYLNVLVSRPDIRRAMGEEARRWVENECTWPKVARKYAEFLDSVVFPERVVKQEEADVGVASGPGGPPHYSSGTEYISSEAEYISSGAEYISSEAEYILSWSPTEAARNYARTHLTRLEKTLAITPAGSADDRILEMGVYLQITPALKNHLGYGEVRGCYYGPAGQVERRTVTRGNGEAFTCDVDLFDAEKDRFPYEDGYFSTVLCCELLEHLTTDPMHMMAEINRILKLGGHVLLTTPNLGSLRAISAILQGFHPGLFPAYIRPRAPGEEPEPRHNREYMTGEIAHLLDGSGFDVTLLETGPFLARPEPEHAWVTQLLQYYELSPGLRGEGIYAVGRKTGPVRERYPAWLYE